MAEKKTMAGGQPTGKELPKAVKKRRQVKEVKTKLSNLSPATAAEVVNEVVTNQTRKHVGGFTSFIREQGVVGVGVGLVLGVQVKAVVDAVMNNFVNPVTDILLPGKGALSSKVVTVSFGTSKPVTIGWGSIVFALFTFLMVALIIYAIYKLLRLDKLKKV